VCFMKSACLRVQNWEGGYSEEEVGHVYPQRYLKAHDRLMIR